MEKPDPKKPPSMRLSRTKVLFVVTPEHLAMQESRKKTRISFGEADWLVDQVELSVLVCECWLGNIMKRSVQDVENNERRPFSREVGIKTSVEAGDTGHGR